MHTFMVGIRYWFAFYFGDIIVICTVSIPRSLEEKIVTRTLGGGGSIGTPPPLSTFNTIHPINMKFDIYNKLHLYFQLSETTWYLNGVHGNDRQIDDVRSGRHHGLLNFQILLKF